MIIDIQDYAFLFSFVIGDELNFCAHVAKSSRIGDFVECSLLSGDHLGAKGDWRLVRRLRPTMRRSLDKPFELQNRLNQLRSASYDGRRGGTTAGHAPHLARSNAPVFRCQRRTGMSALLQGRQRRSRDIPVPPGTLVEFRGQRSEARGQMLPDKPLGGLLKTYP